MAYPKTVRLLDRKDFFFPKSSRLYKNFLLVEYYFNSKSCPRLGLTVSNKYGKAHLRNRFKRRIREIFRTHYNEIPKGLIINILPRKEAKTASFDELKNELLSCIGCLHDVKS